MTRRLKRDADAILAHIEAHKTQPWLAGSQRKWVDHLFHFTDLPNAIAVLGDGVFLSRAQLEKTGGLISDIASPSVIATTPSKWKSYVRLYFRPRTPTQFRNEGFRPINQRELGAHCPVPIAFIFDAKKILTDQATWFSDGCLATTGVRVGNDSSFFTSLPFEKIYHDGALAESEKREIIFHRLAEVMIPKSLDLSDLKWIYCRSQAEFETLVHLLPPKSYRKWFKKIGVGGRTSLFYALWSFVDKAHLSITEIRFTFNPSLTPGPFRARLEIKEKKTGTTYSWEDTFHASETKVFSLSKMKAPKDYVVEFWLDDQLAYQNGYLHESELPF